jgi:hypothetical protein
MRYNRGAGGRVHVAKVMVALLQILFANAQKYWKTKTKTRRIKVQRATSMESVENRDSRKYRVTVKEIDTFHVM